MSWRRGHGKRRAGGCALWTGSWATLGDGCGVRRVVFVLRGLVVLRTLLVVRTLFPRAHLRVPLFRLLMFEHQLHLSGQVAPFEVGDFGQPDGGVDVRLEHADGREIAGVRLFDHLGQAVAQQFAAGIPDIGRGVVIGVAVVNEPALDSGSGAGFGNALDGGDLAIGVPCHVEPDGLLVQFLVPLDFGKLSRVVEIDVDLGRFEVVRLRAGAARAIHGQGSGVRG